MIDHFYAPETATQQQRNNIEEKHLWDLTDLFPSDEAWKAQKEASEKDIPALADYKGKLGAEAKTLLTFLEKSSHIEKDLTRVYSYAAMKSDQDTRVSKYQGMKQEMQQVYANFSATVSFFSPEILAIGQETIHSFMAQEKGLQIYAFMLDDILRTAAHTGTPGEEKIMAQAGLMSSNAQNIFSIFANAEFPYPEVTISSGETVRLNQSAFALQRSSHHRADREQVFKAFFTAIGQFKSTFGAQLSGNVKSHLFYKNARGYQSCLEMALNANNIPVEVYHSLIENVDKNIGTFHRYLSLRKKLLGIAQLHYYDLYAPLLGDIKLEYSVDEAQQHILASLTPLGTSYTDIIDEAFRNRWIDMYPTEGKRSGAYSNGSAYDVHPYMLMNYNGQFNDVSTLTHELGHTMQSYLSNQKQPYPTANYPIFVAEVASTFSEALLSDYMLKQLDDDKIRFNILGNYLEGVKGTVFRQAQFAAFELLIHELTEKGEALTGERLSELYMELTKKYYGHDQGTCIVDDYIQYEWCYIPHFYYNFYVYQYATSFTASEALSEKVIAGDKEATQKYLDFLSAGGSDYPIELLKKAGVDMTTSEPFDLTMRKMNKVMDEMEAILERME